MEMRKRRQEAMLKKNMNAAMYVDENSPVRGLFSPEELQEKFGIKPNENGDSPALDQIKDPNLKDLLKSTTKKKKKKKKKMTAAAVEMMFEGGSSSEE
jgi:hypothetical protein